MSNAVDTSLPAAFAELEPFVRDGWAEGMRRDRTEKRLTSSMEEIRAFYDAVVPKLQPMLAYLDTLDLKTMPADAKRLLNLTFMVADVRYAVESFGEPENSDGWDTRRFVISE